jgi:hypothetical protein
MKMRNITPVCARDSGNATWLWYKELDINPPSNAGGSFPHRACGIRDKAISLRSIWLIYLSNKDIAVDEDKKSLKQRHDEHRAEHWNYGDSMKYWRSWGSWFSWGSPVGLGLGYALILLSTGGFLWILAHR